jgi:protocatechuate 3,4-dioxygenase alpha subunit
MSRLPVTGSQTVGPYFRIGMAPLFRENLAGPEVSGERVTIHGRVLDGDGAGIPDASIETWQADAQGDYGWTNSPGRTSFHGFARVPTHDRGEFHFTTIRPGRVAGPENLLQAPHLVVLVFMRGLLRHLVTRMYFPDDAANASDAILQLVPAERQHTLIAKRENAGEATFEWNICMQGDDETVFFDV